MKLSYHFRKTIPSYSQRHKAAEAGRSPRTNVCGLGHNQIISHRGCIFLEGHITRLKLLERPFQEEEG